MRSKLLPLLLALPLWGQSTVICTSNPPQPCSDKPAEITHIPGVSQTLYGHGVYWDAEKNAPHYAAVNCTDCAPPQPGDYLQVGPDGTLRKVPPPATNPAETYLTRNLHKAEKETAAAMAAVEAAGHAKPIDTTKLKEAADWLSRARSAEEAIRTFLNDGPPLVQPNDGVDWTWNCEKEREELRSATETWRYAYYLRVPEQATSEEKEARGKWAFSLLNYWREVALGCGVPQDEVDNVELAPDHRAAIRRRIDLRDSRRRMESRHAQ